MTTTVRPPASVGAAHRAVLVVFALAGGIFASWASRIPDAKQALGLGAGELGLLLLCMSAGSVIGLPASGRIAEAIGTRRTTTVGSALCLTSFVAVGAGVSWVGSPVVAGIALFCAGFGLGVWEVSMNVEGAAVERRLSRAVMPHYHAAFSGGTVVAALVGAGLSAAGVGLALHLGAFALLAAPVMAYAVRSFDSGNAESTPEADSRSAWLEPRTLIIGVVVLAAAFTEGTANDWLSVAIAEGHDLPNWGGVLGFAVFLSLMTAGRIAGPVILGRYGRVPALRGSFALALVGCLLVVFGDTTLAFVGAAVWGLGTALGFPVGMSAAADDPARAARRISVTTTIGYTAFLAGPPLLGLLGEHVGVLRSLLVVAGMVAIALLCVPAAREPDDA